MDRTRDEGEESSRESELVVEVSCDCHGGGDEDPEGKRNHCGAVKEMKCREREERERGEEREDDDGDGEL